MLWLSLLILSLATPSQAVAPPSGGGVNVFAIKADRYLARRINPVLAEYGAPEKGQLKEGQSASAYLRALCRFAPPTGTVDQDDPSGRTIRHAPCLLGAPKSRVPVRPGDSLPIFVARMGLMPGSQSDLKIHKIAKLPRPRPDTLHIGDKVTALDAPAWTRVEVSADRLADRAALMAVLAEALDCGGQAPEACLRDFNIQVVDNTPRKLISTPPVEGSPQSSAPPSGDLKLSADQARSALDFARPAAQDAPAPDAPEPPASPVAPGQWPYDRDLVGRILKSAAEGNVVRTRVAVIDIGLGDAEGGPMPSYVYPEKDPETDDALRQFGDGPPFTRDRASPVAICHGANVEIAALMADETQRAAFSHGAVTASLAAGVPLYAQGIPAKVLPQLIFLRLYSQPCPPTGQATVQPLDIISAFESVYEDVDIITIGRQDSQGETPGLASALAQGLAPNKLLILPAGNDGAGDLDEAVGQYCPTCLANPKYVAYGSAISQRVLAVGAANDRLERESFSAYGAQTVVIYASGVPSGALDLAGKDASDLKPGTSYAAPYVMMAAAIAQTLAPNVDLERIVWRLRLAVWPLMRDGKPLPAGGVLDLTKVAAINYYSVEAWWTPPGQTRAVLRTYVGKLTKPLASYPICPGPGFAADKFQGIVLGVPEGGWREVVAYPQRYFKRDYRPLRVPACQPKGNLAIVDIRDGLQEIPFETITRILPPLVR